MAKYDVTNESKGARFVGAFLIDGGESLTAVELDENIALALAELDGVSVVEAKPAKAVAKAATEAKE